MKKLIFVFGIDSSHMILSRPKLPKEYSSLGSDVRVMVTDESSHVVLKRVLEAIQVFASKCTYKELFVFYVGKNLDLFHDNLPCDSIDLGLLERGLELVTQGKDTPQQKELLQWMFNGAILGLINSISTDLESKNTYPKLMSTFTDCKIYLDEDGRFYSQSTV